MDKTLFVRQQEMERESESTMGETWDCAAFHCGDECCRHGVDVLPQEKDALISAGMATEAFFSGPRTDEDGKTVYRTQKGPRGCIFLGEQRGCRLHFSGYKPSICRAWPRSLQEASRAADEGDLPCFSFRYTRETNDENLFS